MFRLLTFRPAFLAVNKLLSYLAMFIATAVSILRWGTLVSGIILLVFMCLILVLTNKHRYAGGYALISIGGDTVRMLFPALAGTFVVSLWEIYAALVMFYNIPRTDLRDSQAAANAIAAVENSKGKE